MDQNAQQNRAPRGRILCVDDEPGIVRALDWLLRRNFDVTTATSGDAAIALIQQNDFDVIISDQRMPGMTGVELLKTARQLAPRTMRILLTGYSDLQAVLASVNEGEVFRFINKPWNVDELPDVVAQAVGLARTAPVAPADPEKSVAQDPEAASEPVLLIDADDRVHEAFTEAMADEGVKVLHAATLVEAVTILDGTEVGVIVSDTKVGSLDATRLIRMLKSRQPDIVSVMLSKESDAETITSLINQGQIYRYVPKPIRPGYMRLVVNSALNKHRQMRSRPELAHRHSVEDMPESLAVSLEQELAYAGGGGSGSRRSASKSGGGEGGFVKGIVSSFKRLFGR